VELEPRIQRNTVVVKSKEGGTVMPLAHGYGSDQNMWRLVTPAFEGREPDMKRRSTHPGDRERLEGVNALPRRSAILENRISVSISHHKVVSLVSSDFSLALITQTLPIFGILLGKRW